MSIGRVATAVVGSAAMCLAAPRHDHVSARRYSLLRPDVSLSYAMAGTGPTVLLLSGGPGYSGQYLTSVFDHLATNARAVLLDQRGTGQSRPARIDSTTVTVQKEVDDIDALRVALHVDRIVLFGHSWGGELAMAYAAAHPEHVAGLMLAGSGGPSLRSQAIVGQRLAARLTAADVDSIKLWSARANGPRRAEALRELSRLNHKAYLFDLRNAPAVEREKGDSYSADMSKLILADLARTRFDLSAALSAIGNRTPAPFPVALVYGDADVIGSTTAPEITALMPHAEVHVLPRSGHYPWIEATEAFYAQLDRFIARIRL